MEIGEDDNIERKMKVCLPSRVAAILKQSPIVLQGNSAIVTIDPEDGRRSGVRLEEQAGFTRSIQICASIDVGLALSWERASLYDCSGLNGASLPKHVKVSSRCWEGSFESESSSEVQLCVASSVVNAGLVGDDSKVKQGC